MHAREPRPHGAKMAPPSFLPSLLPHFATTAVHELRPRGLLEHAPLPDYPNRTDAKAPMGATQKAQATRMSRKRRRRNFDGVEGGAVGLGIVAAMGVERSGPIPIVSRVASAFKLVEVERSESHMTCAISHVPFRKKVYLEGEGAGGGGGGGGRGEVVFFQSPVMVVEAPPLLPAGRFLSHCSLCGNSLHGIDIFMYRGERAFCSSECRFQHMLGDEHREKYCSSELLKPCEHSISPCPAPVRLPTGVAAA